MKMKKMRIVILAAMLAAYPVDIRAQDAAPESGGRVLGLDEFLETGTRHDTEFEEILIDELILRYQKALRLPAKDLVLSVKQQHEFYLDQDRESPDTTVSLSKLFPYTGTEVEAAYRAGSSLSSSTTTSEMSVGLSQPIARNAFGRSTRLLDQIVGLEVVVARHQIVEAYEDYMAVIMTAYYDWYEAWESLRVGQSAYDSDLKLLDNILDRQKQKIALPVDVNKVRLQVMSREERLIELEESYKSHLNTIERIIRYDKDQPLVPAEPRAATDFEPDFKTSFEAFRKDSRTFRILRLLEEKSGLQVSRDADALLPSIDLLIGYQLSGEKYIVEDENNFLYAGVQMEWPFPNQTSRAGYQVSRILERRAALSTTNTWHRLYTQLRNLYLRLEREDKLIRIAGERIQLARDVLDAEAENYSFGKITLNDYIQAVNALNTNRFNKISRESSYKKFLVEWLRLTDRLVRSRDVLEETGN